MFTAKCPNCRVAVDYGYLVGENNRLGDCPVNVTNDRSIYVTYVVKPCGCRVHSSWWKSFAMCEQLFNATGVIHDVKDKASNYSTILRTLQESLTLLYKLENNCIDQKEKTRVQRWTLIVATAIQAIVPGIHNKDAEMIRNDAVAVAVATQQAPIDEDDVVIEDIVALSNLTSRTIASNEPVYSVAVVADVLEKTTTYKQKSDSIIENMLHKTQHTNTSSLRASILYDLRNFVDGTDESRARRPLSLLAVEYVRAFSLVLIEIQKNKGNEHDCIPTRRRRRIRWID